MQIFLLLFFLILDLKDNDASSVFGTLLFLLDSFLEPIIPYELFETVMQATSIRNNSQIKQVKLQKMSFIFYYSRDTYFEFFLHVN